MSESDSMFNEQDRRCAAVQPMLSTDPSYDNRTIASTLKMQIRMVSTLEGTGQLIGRPFGGGGAEAQGWGHRQEDPDQGVHQKGPGNHWWNSPAVWWSPGAIRWPVADPGCGSRVRRQPTSPKRPRLGFRRSATTLYPSLTGPLLPWPEPAGLLRLVLCRGHHQHDLPQYQSQPDHRHPPSIRRAPAGACGKGILSVPDPYRGGDWGWRQLHWIDVSSTI